MTKETKQSENLIQRALLNYCPPSLYKDVKEAQNRELQERLVNQVLIHQRPKLNFIR